MWFLLEKRILTLRNRKKLTLDSLDRADRERRSATTFLQQTSAGGEPRRVGRPPVTERLDRNLHIRISGREHDALVALAETSGRSIGDTVRRILRACVVHRAKLSYRGKTLEI